MSGVIKAVGKVAGIVAAGLAIATGVGAIAGATIIAGIASATAVMTVAGVVSVGASLLTRPKAPSVSPATTDRLTASIDTKAFRKLGFGKTALATDIRDQEITGAEQDEVHRFVVLASHKIASIDELWLDDKLAWTATGGIAAEFLGYLGVEGYTEGSAANAKNISPRMGNTRRYTGLAWMYLRFKVSGNSKKAESPFAQSIPSRVTIVGKGALVYDPRLDSTVPGGFGPMRADDQTTWGWDDDAARNPALQTLWYLLGWRIQNPVTSEWRLAVGKGIPPARIDLASFITAANLCDEPVALAGGGTQPRYRSDGLFSEGDPTSVVLDQLKASMNAELDDLDGKIRITVAHNDLATPIADFSEDDILGAFTWDQTAPLEEMFNVVRGTFIDPSPQSLYQAVDFPEVRIDSPDGIDRYQPVNFQTVQDARQAQRLAKQRIARMLYSGRFTATFGHRAWRVQKNDVVRLTFAPLGWTNKLFRVVQTAVQVDGQVPMVLQVEHADIYLWDADERPAIEPVEPTTYDPYLNPIYQDIVDPKYGDGTSIDDFRSTVETQIGDIQDALEGISGEFVLTGQLTNPSFNIFAYADGTLVSTAGASGTFIVKQGNTVVPASSVEFSSSASAGVTGSINADGDYSVTGLTVDNGSLTLTAIYAGVPLTQIFKVTRTIVGYEIVSSLPTTNLFEGRVVFLDTDGKLYRYHASAWTKAVEATDISGQIIASQISDGAVSIAKFASGIQPVAIVSSVPGSLSTRAVFNTTDGKLYRWNGSAYVATVPTTDLTGTIITAQIADAALTTAKFASGIQPVTIVSAVPGSLSTRTVFNTTDGKMYRWNGSAYVATVPTSDLTGTVTDAQIAGMAASKVTGTLSDSQLAAISAAKITGQITSTQITDGAISTPKLAAGSVTAAQIAADTITAAQIAAGAITASELAAGSVIAGKIAAGTIQAIDIAAGAITTAKLAAGAVTANEIAADTITAGQIAAGAISASEIAAGAVVAGKIAANAVTSNEILAGSITTAKIAAGAVTATQIAADTITAAQIAAGAISASEIAAGAVTTNKLAIIPESLIPDPYFRDPTYWAGGGVDAGGWFPENSATGNFIEALGAPSGLTLAPIGATIKYAWGAVLPFSGVGQVLRLRFRALNPGADAMIATLLFRDKNNAVIPVYLSINIPAGTSSPQTFTAQQVVPEGTCFIQQVVYNDGSVASASHRSITALKLDVAASAELLVDGSITASKIVAGSITGDRIAANTIAAGNIGSEQITADKIAAGAIIAGKIAANAVTALTIAVDTITASKFVTDAGVDLAAIVPGAINTATSATQVSPVNMNDTTSSSLPLLATSGIACGADDFIYLRIRAQITASSSFIGIVYVDRYVNGVLSSTLGGYIGDSNSFLGVSGAQTRTFTVEDGTHPAGLIHYVLRAVCTGGTATFNNSYISYRRFAMK
ncbi:hypothetical protein SLG_22220 [Sphingobium sp. SYK-6]|uniref:hypothetical protein n=1 Tax=Sphingobium sp. (strain NBRC 103272 / SYK-6) TaxID=627192 RepID=UPI000227713D|nr:hypothetical protein [Sphingobium sp. SYK-6]BAK66897.1 hypothetical protein SLG_22220 [Sphingobium sp. SYK-6]